MEHILKSVFNKYSTDGHLTVQQFILLLSHLSKYVEELKDIEKEFIYATFAFWDKNQDGLLSYQEFDRWWKSQERYSFLIGKKALQLYRVHELYKKYASDIKSSKGGKMTIDQFIKLLKDNGIQGNVDDFDDSDINDDGLLSFNEFVVWMLKLKVPHSK